MIQKFSYSHQSTGDVVTVRVSGYLEKTGGIELRGFFEKCLQEGSRKFIFDFSRIEVINSPGAAGLLSIVSRVVDDFDGKVAAFGLNSHHLAVLDMAGFFYLGVQASDEANALSLVNS